MPQVTDTVQRIRQLPRRKRLVMIILPLMLVGTLDIIRAYRRGDRVEMAVVAVTSFVIAPLIAALWDRVTHD